MKLHQGKVIVYPTESVFGLGCDPDNEKAICTLLSIKKRSWKKGFILVAANYKQLMQYVDDSRLNAQQRSRVLMHSLDPTTWLVPAHINTPYWLTGQYSYIAVRIIRFAPVYHLCLAFGKPLISTSANLSGYPPARTITEIYTQLGKQHNLYIMQDGILGGGVSPSKIKNVMNEELIRK